jgi:general secretion pathway protein B
VGGALVLNAVVLAIWLLRPTDDATAPTTVTADQPRAAAPAAPPAARPTASTPAVAAERTPADYAARAAATTPSPAPARTPSPVAAADTALAATRDPEPTPEPTPEQTPEPAATASAAAPSPLAIRDLPDRIQRRIPQLDFATHIYGDAPRYREVTINGRRYGEGERVEGMLLSEITESGVVFDFEGFRFAVSVLEDWDY